MYILALRAKTGRGKVSRRGVFFGGLFFRHLYLYKYLYKWIKFLVGFLFTRSAGVLAQPGKSRTKKVDEIPRSLDSRIFDHFVQDFPGKWLHYRNNLPSRLYPSPSLRISDLERLCRRGRSRYLPLKAFSTISKPYRRREENDNDPSKRFFKTIFRNEAHFQAVIRRAMVWTDRIALDLPANSC
uniref:Uncharacterized protein n=1 Tax=Candidatus Kentrum sp. LPFa TaxID=2126335 RepID=A0A450WRR3_9GAMM|nr:MAG: hypothetical protein BECKLPF1236B_GA0070989_11836 [Candidatus Kentron sp. LPFa]